jgi:hypothetical protein
MAFAQISGLVKCLLLVQIGVLVFGCDHGFLVMVHLARGKGLEMRNPVCGRANLFAKMN